MSLQQVPAGRNYPDDINVNIEETQLLMAFSKH